MLRGRSAKPYDRQAQQVQQFRALVDGGLERYVPGPQQIELVAGGNSASTPASTTTPLDSGPHADQVRPPYRGAGFDLDADLASLTRDADIEADLEVVAPLTRTSTVTGELDVPWIAVHTVADELVLAKHEDCYAEQVARPATPTAAPGRRRRHRSLRVPPTERSPHSTPSSTESRPAVGRGGRSASAER